MVESILIGAGVSLLSNLFSGESEQEKAIKAINAKINSVKGFSSEDMVRRSRIIENAGNTSVMSAANNFAIRGGDRQGLVTAGLSGILPQVSSAIAEQRIKDEDFNKNLPFLQAQAMMGTVPYTDADTPQSDFLSSVGLGLNVAGVADQIFTGFNLDDALQGIGIGKTNPSNKDIFLDNEFDIFNQDLDRFDFNPNVFEG